MRHITKVIGAIIVIALFILAGFYMNDASTGHDALEPIWYRTWGDENYSWASSIAMQGSNFYVTGSTYDHAGNPGNVFLLKYDLDGGLLWERIWGTDSESHGISLIVDNLSVFVIGWTYSEKKEGRNAFLLRYDHAGKLLWNRTWGDNSNDEAYSIAIGNSNIYVVGISYNTNMTDAFLREYDLSGNLIMSEKWRTSGYDVPNAITIDDSYLYVTGVRGLFNIGYTSKEIFLVKCDLNGKFLWNQTWNRSGSDRAQGIAIDSTNIYLAGSTLGDVVVLKYDKDGTLLWNKTISMGRLIDYASAIVVNGANIYITGTMNVFDGDSDKVFISKLSLDGNVIWSKWFGKHLEDSAASISVDSSNVYVAGLIHNHDLQYGCSHCAFILKTDSDGSDGRIKRSLLIGIISIDIALILVLIMVISPSRKKRDNMPSS